MIRCVIVCALMLASSGGAVLAAPASAAQGYRLARTACGQCHAVEPTGASPNPAAPPFRDLTRFEPGHSIDEVFAKGILVSHAGMPRFGLSEQDQADLLAYARALQPRTAP